MLTSRNTNALQERLLAMPTDELLEVATNNRYQYSSVALEIADAELRRRGVDFHIPEPKTEEPKTRREKAIELVFAFLLLTLVAVKVYAFSRLDVMPSTGATIGAVLSPLGVWYFARRLSLRLSTQHFPLLFLGVAATVISIFGMPIFGWLLVLAMYLVQKYNQ